MGDVAFVADVVTESTVHEGVINGTRVLRINPERFYIRDVHNPIAGMFNSFHNFSGQTYGYVVR